MKAQKVTLPVPYSAAQKATKKEASEAYFQHRSRNRFVEGESNDVQKASPDFASRIANLNFKMGKAINQTLTKGFTAIEKQQINIHESLLDQTEVIQTGFDTIEYVLHKGFGNVVDGLEDVAHGVGQVNEMLVKVGGNLEEGLKEVKSSIDMGMVNILTQFELQREEMQAGFESLVHLLENQHKTTAQERYLDGKLSYEQFLKHPDEPQFLIDAHQYFQESVNAYRGNPYCHLYLGHIYHEAASLYDLEKSRTHYLLCATYAKGMANPSLAALGYFMAAWISYTLTDVDKAIELGLKGLEFESKGNPEAFFNIGKYYAYAHEMESAIHHLDIAVEEFDPLYALKASLDADFQIIKSDLDEYFIRKRDHEAQLLMQKITEFGVEI